MAKEVIKKDGTREPFDVGKIRNSIAAASAGAGLEEERKNEVIEEVTAAVVQMADAREEITTSELKEKILSELDRVEQVVSESWRKYDQEKNVA